MHIQTTPIEPDNPNAIGRFFDITFAVWIDGKPTDTKIYKAVEGRSWQHALTIVRSNRASDQVKDGRTYWTFRERASDGSYKKKRRRRGVRVS